MRRRTLQNSSEEEKRPVEALSPDGMWRAYAARENTIALTKKGVGYWGTYLGHQDGMFHRTSARIEQITWESASLVRSLSSTGSIHLWSVPRCFHVETIRSAIVGRSV